jgi:hypothetical protein
MAPPAKTVGFRGNVMGSTVPSSPSRKGVVSEKPRSRNGENGFAGLLDGQFGADDSD